LKLTFKQFLVENGFPFAYVVDDKKLDIFGREEKDLIKKKKGKKLSKEENTKRKLNSYIQYAKSIDEE